MAEMVALHCSQRLLQHCVLFEELFDRDDRLSLHFEGELLHLAEQFQLYDKFIGLAHPQVVRFHLAEHIEELLWSGEEGMEYRRHELLVKLADESVWLAGVLEFDEYVVMAQLEDCVEVTDVPCGLFSLH